MAGADAGARSQTPASAATHRWRGTLRDVRRVGLGLRTVLLLAPGIVTVGHAAPARSGAPDGAGREPITVVLRFDDYMAGSRTDLESRLFDGLAERGVPLTVAVVPYAGLTPGAEPAKPADRLLPLPPDKIQILKAAMGRGMLEVAQHGYSHGAWRADPKSEFVGRDFAEQKALIAAGRHDLEGWIGGPVSIFIPPWNSYDDQTLRAIEALGFRTLSARRLGSPLPDGRLAYLPYTLNGPGELMQAVQTARRSSEARPLIVAMLHQYDFREVTFDGQDTTVPNFFALIDRLRAMPDVRFSTIGGEVASRSDLGGDRLAAATAEAFARRLLPMALQGDAERLLYLSGPSRHAEVAKALAFYGALVALSLAAAIGVAAVGYRRLRHVDRIAVVLLAGLVAFAVQAVMRDWHAGLRHVLTSPVPLSLACGLAWSMYRRSRLRRGAGLAAPATPQGPRPAGGAG